MSRPGVCIFILHNKYNLFYAMSFGSLDLIEGTIEQSLSRWRQYPAQKRPFRLPSSDSSLELFPEPVIIAVAGSSTSSSPSSVVTLVI